MQEIPRENLIPGKEYLLISENLNTGITRVVFVAYWQVIIGGSMKSHEIKCRETWRLARIIGLY